VRQGLLTDAIGAGRKTAHTIDDIIAGKRPAAEPRTIIDIRRVHLEYYDPRVVQYESLDQCGSQCASCGQCRDCGICVAICPESAISRAETADGSFEYAVSAERCIGCGFCAGACPCGVWNLVENFQLG
jgi:ferredoxin